MRSSRTRYKSRTVVPLHCLSCRNVTNILVKTNSKNKEDDCTNSNADVNSLDVCVLRIHFRNTTHHTCQIPAHPSSRFTQQSALNTQDIRNSVSALAPS